MIPLDEFKKYSKKTLDIILGPPCIDSLTEALKIMESRGFDKQETTTTIIREFWPDMVEIVKSREKQAENPANSDFYNCWEIIIQTSVELLAFKIHMWAIAKSDI